MEKRKAADVAAAFYAALAAGDRDQLDALLDPEFTGRTAEGMPFGIGGVHDSPAAMRRNSWGVIARHFEARAEPERFLDLADGRLLVTGRYRGRGKQGGAALDAAFAHLIAVDQGRIRSNIPTRHAGVRPLARCELSCSISKMAWRRCA